MAIQTLIAAAAEAPARHYALAAAALVATYIIATVLYRSGPLHPLHRIPGPLLNRITYAPLAWHSYRGDEAQYVHRLHVRHGPTVRVAPDAVDFSSVAALRAIYLGRGGGFAKARHYRNFDIDGHASIFSNPDVDSRGARAKVVLPLFSTASIRAKPGPFRDGMARYLRQFREARDAGRVNALDLARSLGIDSVTEYLFGIRYGAFDSHAEGHDGDGHVSKPVKSDDGGAGAKMSASDVVDNFISTSRLFYLPGRLYEVADRVDALLFPNPGAGLSTDIVNGYVDRVVEAAEASIADGKDKDSKFTTFPARLLRAGFSRDEVHAQCKDIIFAGTDTIGMNLATLCFMLARHPAAYDRLHAEVSSTPITRDEDIQTKLPYLTCVIREGLRLSMTNPSMLPREVPTNTTGGGWTHDGVHYPRGTVVSCSVREMHMSEELYGEQPAEFRPERWEEATEDMSRCMMAFGLGGRQCIARGMSMLELHEVLYQLVREDLLRGARAVADCIDILEGFSAKVVGGRVDLVW